MGCWYPSLHGPRGQSLCFSLFPFFRTTPHLKVGVNACCLAFVAVVQSRKAQPDQAVHRHPSMDVFCLGATFYFAVENELPSQIFDEKDLLGNFRSPCWSKYPKVCQCLSLCFLRVLIALCLRLFVQFFALVQRMTKVDRDERPTTAQVAAELHAIQATMKRKEE